MLSHLTSKQVSVKSALLTRTMVVGQNIELVNISVSISVSVFVSVCYPLWLSLVKVLAGIPVRGQWWLFVNYNVMLAGTVIGLTNSRHCQIFFCWQKNSLGHSCSSHSWEWRQNEVLEVTVYDSLLDAGLSSKTNWVVSQSQASLHRCCHKVRPDYVARRECPYMGDGAVEFKCCQLTLLQIHISKYFAAMT